jgi:hypothetical protein
MDHVHSSHALSTAHMHSPNAYKILVSLYKALHQSMRHQYLRRFVLIPGPLEVLIIRKDVL